MVEVYQFGPFNSEDGTMSLMHPSLSPTERLVKKSAYDAVADELVAVTDELRGAAGARDLRIRALEADITDVAKINVDLMKRNRALEAALRQLHHNGRHAIGGNAVRDRKIIEDALVGSQTETERRTKLNPRMFASLVEAINNVIENDDDAREGYVYPALAQDMAEAARQVYNACQLGQEFAERERGGSVPNRGGVK